MRLNPTAIFLGLALPVLAAGCAGQLPPLGVISASLQPELTSNSPPVSLYADVARRIRSCWFAAAKPVLNGHVFFAETPTDGEAAEAHISISAAARDGRRGLKAFTIDFLAYRDGTAVRTNNLRFPPALAAQLKDDVRRWVAGQITCSAIAPLRGPVYAQPRRKRR